MRLITKHSPIRPTRIFFSHKNNAAYFMESGLEREFALRCEFDPKVLSYRCQPDPIYYSLPGNGRRRRYTPDTLIEHADLGSLIIEVKPRRHALKPVLQAKHERLKEIYAENSADFRVVTEFDIREQQRISNYSYFYKFRGFDIDESELAELKRYFPNGMTLKEIIEQFPEKTDWPSLAHHAVALFKLRIDFTQQRSAETRMEWIA